VTIQGLDDAAHIFHGVVNKLGAVLTDVIDWLQARVLKLLADTVTLAARYDGWLLQLSDELYTLSQKAKSGADHWLPAQEEEIHKVLDKLKTAVGSKPVSSFSQPPKYDTKLNANAQSTPQQPTSANASWLLEKVGQSGVALAKTPAVDDALSTLMKQAEASIASVGQDFINAANKFRNTLAGLVSNPKNFGNAVITDVIDALGDMIKAGFDAARGVIDVVLNLAAVAIAAFKAILSAPLSNLPLIGPLLNAAGMTKGLTIGGLVTLLVAFPAALGYKLAHLDADSLPFKSAKDQLSRAGRGHGGRSQLRHLRRDLFLGLDGHDRGDLGRGRRRAAGVLRLGRHRGAGGDQRPDGARPRRRPSVQLDDQAR